MGAIDLVRALIAEGVEFATDGERIRWRNSEGRMTPKTIAQIASAKPEAIDFLTRKPRPAPPVAGEQPDPDTYLAFLRSNGPATYGAMATSLGWGATRAWQAEARLGEAGRVTIDKRGKATALDRAGRAPQPK
jgi:hypothetical protein